MKTLLSFSILFSASIVFAEDLKTVTSKIDSVTVYLDGAGIVRSAQVKITPGQKQYVFSDLSPKLNPESINITASGGVTIMSIVNKTNFLAQDFQNPVIQQLKDSLALLSDQKGLLQTEKNVFTEEKDLLNQNKPIGGTAGVSIAELQKAADFYRARVMQINMELYRMGKEENKISETMTRINLQLKELNAKFNPPKSEITVTVKSSAAVTSSFVIRYVVTNTGWAPFYDLVANGVSQPIILRYRANAYNNTGEDWNDVKIKLSTADAMRSASKPQLKKWSLNYDNRTISEGLLNTQLNIQRSLDLNLYNNRTEVNKDIPYQQIEVSELNSEFDVKEPYTIPADAKPYLLEIKEHELPADFQYYSAPKIERGAFLIAKVTGWEDLDLVEGTANVYFGNTYIGRSYIYTRSMEDTLDLSLGTDNKILVTRKKLKEFSSKNFFGTTRKETYTYEIQVKNNRDEPVQIDLEDQVPITEESEIKVEALEISKAELDDISGILRWHINLASGQSEKVVVSFSVKYPKNRRIHIYQSKVMYCPRF